MSLWYYAYRSASSSVQNFSGLGSVKRAMSAMTMRVIFHITLYKDPRRSIGTLLHLIIVYSTDNSYAGIHVGRKF